MSILRTWLLADLNWEGRERMCCGSAYICGRAFGQTEIPSRSWEWLEEVPILGEDQVQLRPAESERLGDSWRGVSGRQLGLKLQGEAWAAGGHLGLAGI